MHVKTYLHRSPLSLAVVLTVFMVTALVTGACDLIVNDDTKPHEPEDASPPEEPPHITTSDTTAALRLDIMPDAMRAEGQTFLVTLPQDHSAREALMRQRVEEIAARISEHVLEMEKLSEVEGTTHAGTDRQAQRKELVLQHLEVRREALQAHIQELAELHAQRASSGQS